MHISNFRSHYRLLPKVGEESNQSITCMKNSYNNSCTSVLLSLLQTTSFMLILTYGKEGAFSPPFTSWEKKLQVGIPFVCTNWLPLSLWPSQLTRATLDNPIFELGRYSHFGVSKHPCCHAETQLILIIFSHQPSI